jgi:hypothetical protein
MHHFEGPGGQSARILNRQYAWLAACDSGENGDEIGFNAAAEGLRCREHPSLTPRVFVEHIHYAIIVHPPQLTEKCGPI